MPTSRRHREATKRARAARSSANNSGNLASLSCGPPLLRGAGPPPAIEADRRLEARGPPRPNGAQRKGAPLARKTRSSCPRTT
eukprot:11214571-Lingulodinium_polyedra.AAC.2